MLSRVQSKRSDKVSYRGAQSSAVQSSSGWNSQSGSQSINEEARFDKGFSKFFKKKDEMDLREEEHQRRETDKAILERFKSFHLGQAVQEGMYKNGLYRKEMSPKNEDIGVQSPKIIEDIKRKIKTDNFSDD